MIFLSSHTLYNNIRSVRDIDRYGLLGATASLDWSAVWFASGANEKVECFYTMLNFLCVGSRSPKGTDYAAFGIG
jgi:hypothetical protein